MNAAHCYVILTLTVLFNFCTGRSHSYSTAGVRNMIVTITTHYVNILYASTYTNLWCHMIRYRDVRFIMSLLGRCQCSIVAYEASIRRECGVRF